MIAQILSVEAILVDTSHGLIVISSKEIKPRGFRTRAFIVTRDNMVLHVNSGWKT